jgi:tetratricopeptide (TPR) repeat protein
MSRIRKYRAPGKLRASYISSVAEAARVFHLKRSSLCSSLAFSLFCFTLIASSLHAAKSPVVRIIVVNTQSEAENILSELGKGRSFASLAKERSIEKKSRERFGEVGADAFDGLDKPLKEAALKLGVGEVSKLIKLGDKRYALVLIVDMSNYRKGAKAFREGDFKTAEVDLLRHIELNPDAVKARVILGRIYGAGNETKKAEVNYKDALRFDPDCEEAYLRLGALYLSAGQFQQAKDIYDDGLNHLPDSKSLRTGLEKTKKRLSAAKVEPPKKETAGDEPRGHEIPQTDAGKRQVLKADNPKKEMPVSEALNDGPALIGTSKNTHERKIYIRIIFTEKESDALDILSQVKKGRPFALLAKERSVDEKTREACGYLGEVGVDSLHPSIQEALSKLKEGQTSDAIRMDQNRYAIVQVTDMGLYTEGERAFIAGDYVTAEAKLLRYVETNPDAVKARTMLGKIYESKEEPSKAIEMYKEAISFSPKTVLIYERLARVYLLMGMYLKAKEVYVQGLRQVPSSPVLEEGIEMADMLLIGSGERMP